MGIGDWGLGLGFGDWPQSPIPNPQSPIPNPHLYNKKIIIIYHPNNNRKKNYLTNLIQK